MDDLIRVTSLVGTVTRFSKKGNSLLSSVENTPNLDNTSCREHRTTRSGFSKRPLELEVPLATEFPVKRSLNSRAPSASSCWPSLPLPFGPAVACWYVSGLNNNFRPRSQSLSKQRLCGLKPLFPGEEFGCTNGDKFLLFTAVWLSLVGTKVNLQN